MAICALLTGCIHISVDDDNDSISKNGPSVTKTYTINESYHEIDVSHAFTVTMSDTATVATVTVDSAVLKYVVFRIENGTLKIGLKPGILRNIHALKVTLPYNASLDEIELSGASDFITSMPLNAEEISIDLSGASNFTGDITMAKEVSIEASGASHFEGSIQMQENLTMIGSLEVNLSGASSANIRGCVDVLDIEISGASSLDANSLDTRAVKGEISGASSAGVLCCEGIKVEVSGSSDLTYGTIADGCDPIVDCPATGASTVTRR